MVYGHHVSFLDEQKRTAAKAFYFTESAAGDQQFQAALTQFPTPDKLARAKLETLAKIPHLATEMAETLRAAAAQSTGSNKGPIAEELIRQKVHALRQEQETFAALATLVEQAWDALPDGPAKRIRTIPGIGLQTAAALVAKIVSIKRFATPTALIGYFGVFPEEVDVSGTDRQGNPKQGREIHMSRKPQRAMPQFNQRSP